ncbi:hypothetical protein ACFL1N_00240 [Thermodesulfobacteriota bacterium]
MSFRGSPVPKLFSRTGESTHTTSLPGLLAEPSCLAIAFCEGGSLWRRLDPPSPKAMAGQAGESTHTRHSPA